LDVSYFLFLILPTIQPISAPKRIETINRHGLPIKRRYVREIFEKKFEKNSFNGIINKYNARRPYKKILIINKIIPTINPTIPPLNQ